MDEIKSAMNVLLGDGVISEHSASQVLGWMLNAPGGELEIMRLARKNSEKLMPFMEKARNQLLHLGMLNGAEPGKRLDYWLLYYWLVAGAEQ